MKEAEFTIPTRKHIEFFIEYAYTDYSDRKMTMIMIEPKCKKGC